jgi:hypothetical protein
MTRKNYIPGRRMSDDEINAAIAKFKKDGGEIINLSENFDPNHRKNSETAVKIGSSYLKVAATQKKDQ